MSFIIAGTGAIVFFSVVYPGTSEDYDFKDAGTFTYGRVLYYSYGPFSMEDIEYLKVFMHYANCLFLHTNQFTHNKSIFIFF